MSKPTLIFISIPKTAYGSVRASLQNDTNLILGPDDNDKVYDYLREYDTIGRGQHMLNNIDSEIWKNNVRFTIVRNPYDRIVSSYLEICSFYRDDFNENALKSFKSFLYFLKDNYNNIKPTKGKWHITQQLKNLKNDKTLLVNYIIKFENLQSDYDTLRKMVNLSPKKLPHYNKRQTKHYREYYNNDEKLIKIVTDLYDDDIKYFNYYF